MDETARELLLRTWHRVYGDGDGWTAFKAAVDDGRFDHALEVLAPGLMKMKIVKPLSDSMDLSDSIEVSDDGKNWKPANPPTSDSRS